EFGHGVGQQSDHVGALRGGGGVVGGRRGGGGRRRLGGAATEEARHGQPHDQHDDHGGGDDEDRPPGTAVEVVHDRLSPILLTAADNGTGTAGEIPGHGARPPVFRSAPWPFRSGQAGSG